MPNPLAPPLTAALLDSVRNGSSGAAACLHLLTNLCDSLEVCHPRAYYLFSRKTKTAIA